MSTVFKQLNNYFPFVPLQTSIYVISSLQRSVLSFFFQLKNFTLIECCWLTLEVLEQQKRTLCARVFVHLKRFDFVKMCFVKQGFLISS